MRICNVEDCNAKHYGKGFCAKHYRIQYKRPAASVEKKKKRLAEWRKENTQHVKEYAKSYRQANKEQYRILRRDYYVKNIEKEKAHNKKWHLINREVAVEKSNRYRARKLKAMPNWINPEELRSFYTEASKQKLHVDHIVPLKGENVCGLHVPWNLQAISAKENLEKKNKLTKEGEQLAWIPKL